MKKLKRIKDNGWSFSMNKWEMVVANEMVWRRSWSRV